MLDAIKGCANAILAVVVLVLISGVLIERWYHGEQRYAQGKAEIQAQWDADKATRKAAADKQAADKIKSDKEHQDALKQDQNQIRNTRRALADALERLRNLPALPRGAGLPMAERGGATVSGVAEDSSRTGGRVEQRIGGCEDSSSEPCFVGRGFFDQAVKDAADRALTRKWAKGQGIIPVSK